MDPADNNQDASAALHTGGGMITNVATQAICPGDVYEHLTIGTVDPVAYALAVDALTHPGPADPARISTAVCSQLYMPGVNPLNVNNYVQILDALPTLGSVTIGPTATLTSGATVVKSEPALECYVFATCPPSAPLIVRVIPGRVVARRWVRLRVLVTVDVGGVVSAVPGASVRFGRHLMATDSAGVAWLRARFVRLGRVVVRASAPEYFGGTSAVRVAAPRSRHRRR